MRPPNLLATRWGRMTTFFFLYMSEGLPQGFAALTLATQLRRQGLSRTEVAIFTATLVAPWAWKWAMGPFIDIFSSDRFGRRRLWILVMQCMMIVTLMVAMPIDMTTSLTTLTTVMIIHNVFAATQDVAIDALACGVLQEEERGLGNGLMFAGNWLGSGLGGSGALYLMQYTDADLSMSYCIVAGSLLLILLFIVLPMREPKSKPTVEVEGSRWNHFQSEFTEYVTTLFSAFRNSRPAQIGILFGLLPTGAYGLVDTLQTNLSVDFDFDDAQVATLSLASVLVTGTFCVVGGLLSDWCGRRRMLAVYVVFTAIPTLWFAYELYQAGWITPLDPDSPNWVAPSASLIQMYWIAVLVFAVFHGLLYGTRTALFMDVCTPEVAATQFTAYMAMLNIGIIYTRAWHGYAADTWGYPVTLTIDACVGLLCIGVLPFMTKRKQSNSEPA